MGMLLKNNRPNYCFLTNLGWFECLELGQTYGWQPAGTLPPPEGLPFSESWDGRYYPDHAQLVTSEDAEALACALQRALEDPERPHPQPDEKNPFQDQGDSRFLSEMIDFFRQGSFRIWP